MANLFIGFPVPRAKIADMISGDAPALVHATQHQDGGDDAIDVTGLTGAGGVAFPLRGIWFDDYFVDDDRWRKTYVGSAAITRSYDKLQLKTDDTNPSSAKLYFLVSQPIPTFTWENKRHLIFQCYMDCDDTASASIWIGTGSPSGNNFVGFQVDDGKLYSFNKNPVNYTYHELLTFPDSFIGRDIHLEAIHFPGVKIEYWVDGVLEYTETARVPYGTQHAHYLTYLEVNNEATAYNVQIDFTNIQVYQEA